MQETIKPLDRNRLSVLMAMLLLSSVIFHLIKLPGQTWRMNLLGSPLEIHVTGTWLLGALMVGLVCTGTNLILHGHPHLGKHEGRPIYVSWILPGIMAGFSTYLLSWAPTEPIWMGVLFVVGIAIAMTVSAEYGAFCSDVPGYPTARLALNMLAYLLGFLLFTLIYQTRGRSLITATLILFISFLLSFDLLSVAEVATRRVLVYAGTVALILGESTWALNYWQVSAWAGGLLLLLIFYILVNIANQHLLERLKTSNLLEFAAVAVLVLVVILMRTL